MRTAFVNAATALLDDDARAALVLADISAAAFDRALHSHPDRAINVGIREQLMVSVAGGLALTGLRPIAHSYATFLVERAWEQVKLDLSHQGVAAILVSVGASYDDSAAGRTHHSPGDVALIDTLDGWTVHVPGHPAEVGPLLRAAARHDAPVYLRLSERANTEPRPDADRLVPLRHGEQGLVVAIGPMLDAVLEATEGFDVSVAYTHTPRPLDAEGIRSLMAGGRLIVVEPYLEGTSAHAVTEVLSGIPFALTSIGVGRAELHRYGSPADHDRAHRLDPASLRHRIATALS